MQKIVSVIIPIFNEEDQILDTLKEINKTIGQFSFQFEIILIDDGSYDKSWEVITKQAKNYSYFQAIKFSRNFGKEAALSAGLDNAIGQACIIIDADMQHPPGLIKTILELWTDGGYEIIEAKKRFRGKENFVHKLFSKFFYKLFYRLSGIDLLNASDFKLLDRKVVDAWLKMPERNIFFRGMSAWLGFKKTNVIFDVAKRTIGKSKWPFLKLFILAVDAITSFSSIPLNIITFIGALFFIAALILSIHTLYMKFSGIALSGFTTVILLLLIIGSIIMLSLGIIGIYMSKIYYEIKSRPRYVITEHIKFFNKNVGDPC